MLPSHPNYLSPNNLNRKHDRLKNTLTFSWENLQNFNYRQPREFRSTKSLGARSLGGRSMSRFDDINNESDNRQNQNRNSAFTPYQRSETQRELLGDSSGGRKISTFSNKSILKNSNSGRGNANAMLGDDNTGRLMNQFQNAVDDSFQSNNLRGRDDIRITKTMKVEQRTQGQRPKRSQSCGRVLRDDDSAHMYEPLRPIFWGLEKNQYFHNEHTLLDISVLNPSSHPHKSQRLRRLPQLRLRHAQLLHQRPRHHHAGHRTPNQRIQYPNSQPVHDKSGPYNEIRAIIITSPIIIWF